MNKFNTLYRKLIAESSFEEEQARIRRIRIEARRRMQDMTVDLDGATGEMTYKEQNRPITEEELVSTLNGKDFMFYAANCVKKAFDALYETTGFTVDEMLRIMHENPGCELRIWIVRD